MTGSSQLRLSDQKLGQEGQCAEVKSRCHYPGPILRVIRFIPEAILVAVQCCLRTGFSKSTHAKRHDGNVFGISEQAGRRR